MIDEEKVVEKALRIRIKHPRDCPARLLKIIPNTGGHLMWVCDLDCELDCPQDYVIPKKCPLEDW